MPVTLLMRPKWQDGESWCGYLLRLANLNVIPGFSQMANLGEMTYTSLVSGRPDWVLRRLGVIHQGVPSIVMPDGIKDQLPKMRRPQYTTVCPDCIRSDAIPYLRARWDFPLEVVCHIHKTRLLATCPRCNAQVQTRRGRFLHCQCGMPFCEWLAAKDEFSVDNIRKVLAVELAPPEKLTFQLPDERELTSFVMLRNIAYACGLQAEKTVKKLPRLVNPVDRYDILARSADWFEDWPSTFKTRLLRSGWEPGYQGVSHLDRKALRLHVFPALSQAVGDLVAERRVARLLKERADNINRVPGRMTLLEVKQHLGITGNTCTAWAEAGVFGDVEYEQMKWYSRILVDRNAVRRVQSLLRQTISFEEACEYLETSAWVMHVLLKSAVLREHRFQRAASTARLWRKDLVQFSENICSVAVRVRSVGGMREITRTIENMYKTYGAEFVAYFVSELLDQSVPLYRQRSAKEKLSNLYVTGADLRGFCRRVRNGNALPA